MEFIPRAMITGGFIVPRELQVGDKIPIEKWTRIYAEIAGAGYTYGTFQVAPDGAGVRIQDNRPDDAVIVQPPLVQVQTSLQSELTSAAGAAKTQNIFRIVASVLGVPSVANLGIRIVYNVPLTTNDAKAFILNRVLSSGGEHRDEVDLGGDLWAGVKLVTTSAARDVTYTVQIEPSVADEMRSLFVDVDGQFLGDHKLDAIESQAGQVRSFVDEPLARYLDKLVAPN